jgi:hypothetical protein
MTNWDILKILEDRALELIRTKAQEINDTLVINLEDIYFVSWREIFQTTGGPFGSGFQKETKFTIYGWDCDKIGMTLIVPSQSNYKFKALGDYSYQDF